MKNIYTLSTLALPVLIAIILLVHNAPLLADDGSFVPSYKPTLHVPKIEGKIKIDGEFSEDAWKLAAVADNFAETQPNDQTKPGVESKALIMYDDKNLYIALIAYDDPSKIRTSYSDRDAIFRDDYFGIMLDTYGDQTWGYELFVNPYGIQGDLRMTSGSGEDASFDIVWETMGKITDSGYQVEIAIPFASLRFPDKEKQTWRANFWRDHQRDLRRKYAWAAQDRDNSCFLCQWGYLTGIENIKPGKNIEIIPNIVTSQFGERSEVQDPSSVFDNSDPDAELSFNARYGLTSNSSLELTLNPDFSQVESDEAQIDVNESFGLFFPERRPFFQEGSEMFNSWINAIYTRSINDPKVALKYTSQFGRTGIAILSAEDETSPILIPLRQQARYGLAEKSFVNIFRAKQTVGEDSHVGFMFTDRRYNDFGKNDMHIGGSGTTFGFDANIRIAKNWRIETQTMLSHTEEIFDAHLIIDTTIDTTSTIDTTINRESIIYSSQEFFDNGKYTVDLDGEKYWGDATYLSLERNGRTWNMDIDFWQISPTFRTDAGFSRSNDYRTLNMWTGMYFRPNKKWLINWEPSFSFGRKWNYDGKVDLFSYGESAFDEWVSTNLFFDLRWQSSVSINYVNSQERFFGKNFPGISRLTLELNSRFSEIFGGGIQYKEGTSIWRDQTDPDLGYIRELVMFATLKPSERLIIAPTFIKSKMDRRNSYFDNPLHTGENKNIFDANILRTKLTYQFNRNLFVRVVLQYIDQEVLGDENREVSFEPLVSYKINAFSKFFIGMASGYTYVTPDLNSDISKRLNNLTGPEYSLSNRTLFAKFQYLFRM